MEKENRYLNNAYERTKEWKDGSSQFRCISAAIDKCDKLGLSETDVYKGPFGKALEEEVAIQYAAAESFGLQDQFFVEYTSEVKLFLDDVVDDLDGFWPSVKSLEYEKKHAEPEFIAFVKSILKYVDKDTLPQKGFLQGAVDYVANFAPYNLEDSKEMIKACGIDMSDLFIEKMEESLNKIEDTEEFIDSHEYLEECLEIVYYCANTSELYNYDNFYQDVEKKMHILRSVKTLKELYPSEAISGRLEIAAKNFLANLSNEFIARNSSHNLYYGYHNFELEVVPWPGKKLVKTSKPSFEELSVESPEFILIAEEFGLLQYMKDKFDESIKYYDEGKEDIAEDIVYYPAAPTYAEKIELELRQEAELQVLYKQFEELDKSEEEEKLRKKWC